jgi:hypothetical protein
MGGKVGPWVLDVFYFSFWLLIPWSQIYWAMFL